MRRIYSPVVITTLILWSLIYLSVENLEAPAVIHRAEATSDIKLTPLVQDLPIDNNQSKPQSDEITDTVSTLPPTPEIKAEELSGTTISEVPPGNATGSSMMEEPLPTTIPAIIPILEAPTTSPVCIEKPKIFVFMYHYIRESMDIDNDSTRELSVDPRVFKSHMSEVSALRNTGKVAIISTDELRKDLSSKCFPNANIFVFTVDDGWVDSFTSLAPLAWVFSVPFSFGVISSKIDVHGFMTSEQVRILWEHPLFTIVSHSVNHVDQSKLTREEEKKEFCESKEILEKLIGKTISTYIYPSGRMWDNSEILAKECDYNLAFSTNFWANINTMNDYLKVNRIRMDHDKKASFFEEILSK